MQKANWQAEKIEEFERRFRAVLDYANEQKLPVSVIEATMRDTLASVEARRLLEQFRIHGAKL